MIKNTNNSCLTSDEIIKNGGQVVKNPDGSVSVFYNNPRLGLYPVQLSTTCCKALDPSYIFDINTQTCKWSTTPVSCGFNEPINLIINPKGDDGTLFFVDDFEKETCDLKISFDYLLKIKCEDLLNITNPTITTSYVTNEIQNQINTTQQTIEELNTEIEVLTNNIIVLNEEIAVTPYSIECDKFPIVTVDNPVDCVTSAWSDWSTCTNSTQTRTRTIITAPVNGGIGCPVLSETQACVGTTTPVTPTPTPTTAPTVCCGDITFYPSNYSGEDLWESYSDCETGAINIIVVPYGSQPVTVYGRIACPPTPTPTPKAACNNYIHVAQRDSIITYTDCSGDLKKLPTARQNSYTFCALEGSINGNAGPISLYNGGTGCLTQPAAKMNNFKNTAFSKNSSIVTATEILGPVSTTTTYTSVNYCFTDLGLEVWASILGPIRYQQFLLGDPNSYTCDDVIKLSALPNQSTLFYDCNVPFGTKTTLINELNSYMIRLTTIQNQLTEQQNILIKLESEIVTTTSSNTGCETPTKALESLDIEMHLDVVNSDNSITSVFSAATFPAINSTTHLYNYLTTSGSSSGFYICGDSDCTAISLNTGTEETPNAYSCESIIDSLFKDLFNESGLNDYTTFLTTLSSNALASNWLTYSTVISDPAIIKLITNKKIKISFKINYSCVDFCLLLDNIVLDKSCKTLERHDITISQNPGFDLKRVVDNKKSWVDVTTPTNREFLIAKSNGTNPFRQTDYDVNDERLVINSKEIDLDISIASAIETDVWCFWSDNQGLLTGVTTCNPCLDFTKDFQDDECFIFMDDLAYNFMDGGISNSSGSICCGDTNINFANLVTADLSKINTISDFENLMVSEFIDAKNRQTISAYPTLRAIYERYLASANYTSNTSSKFDYITMDKFSSLIGNYWVDIIEQVIPSTSIWGSVKIYTNTIFDEQKFKYREYTSLICDTRFSELNKTNHIKGIFCDGGDVNIITTVISSNNTSANPKLQYTNCDTIYLAQMNAGSEFIGSVKVEKY